MAKRHSKKTKTPTKKTTEKTKEKKIKRWDILMKQLFDETTNAEHYSDYKVGKLPLEIDYIIHISPQERKSVLQPLFQKYMSDWNIFEFKLARDRDKPTDFWKVKAYCYLFMEKNEFPPQDRPNICAWYICSAKSSIAESPDLKFNILDKGIYSIEFQFPFYLVVIEELPNTKENLVFKLFTTEQQLPEVWDLILKEDLSKDFLSLSFLLYPEELENFLKERGLSLEEVGISMEKAARKYGIKRLINEIGVKAVIDEIGVKAVIDEIGVKAVIDEIGVKAVIDEIGVKAVIDEYGWKNLIEMIDNPEDLKEIQELLEKKQKKVSKKH